MEKEFEGYLKKLAFKSMKFYYGLLGLMAFLLIVALVFTESWEIKVGIGAFCCFLVALIFLMEHSRRKKGRESIWKLYEALDVQQRQGFLDQFRNASEEYWKSGFFPSPEMTVFTNGQGVHALPSSSVLWIYKKIDIFMPVFRFYSIYMYTMSGEKYICEVGMSPIWSGRYLDDAAENGIWRLCRHYPGIIRGYSRELLKLCKGNLAEMRALYEERSKVKNR